LTKTGKGQGEGKGTAASVCRERAQPAGDADGGRQETWRS